MSSPNSDGLSDPSPMMLRLLLVDSLRSWVNQVREMAQNKLEQLEQHGDGNTEKSIYRRRVAQKYKQRTAVCPDFGN
jgi:Tfp pilus assembly protein PilP